MSSSDWTFANTTERARAERGLPWAVTVVAGLSFGGALSAMTVKANLGEISQYFLVVQDAPVLIALTLFCFVMGVWASHGRTISLPDIAAPRDGLRFTLIAAALVACIAFVGAQVVYLSFGLSLDEFMADFDAKVFATGRLLAPVPPEWRDYVPALQPLFILNIPEHAYWISFYLPTNGALRALFVLLGEPTLEGAVLAGIAVAALYGVARRLWADRPDAALVSVVLLVTSSQFLLTAMTPYAMTGHLAFNMVWLWLFLRDTRASHVAAVVVGFVACGLHQVVFHPLFVAPFLMSLLWARRWKLVAFYGVTYAAIGLFWIDYWTLVLRAADASVAQEANVGMAWFIQRIIGWSSLSLDSFAVMSRNLFRFAAWQNPAAIPLALIGLFARRNSIAVNLALGMVFTLAVMLVVMPFQGHGWGYRYWHGCLGSVSLLAAQGWIYLTDRSTAALRRPATGLALCAAFSLFVLLPWRCLQVHAFVEPYATAVRAITQSDAEVVVVDASRIWYGIDLSKNDPFLDGASKTMNLTHLSEQQLKTLCSRYDVAIFDEKDAERFGIRMVEDSAPELVARNRVLRDLMRSLRCGRQFTSPAKT